MKKRVFIFLLIGSLVLNCVFIPKILLPYISMRKLVQETIEQRLEPAELIQYKVKSIKKEVSWWVFFENPDARYDGAHFTVAVEDGSATIYPGM
jgi:hypothetical protein